MSELGWFGKIPALGDFATRRLPLSFVEPWDRWLSQELATAQARLGDAWCARYRHAPVICFIVDTGVLDANAWQGILVPSFDRVGREFPLTITRSHTQIPSRPWWSSLVGVGKRVLEPGFSANDLDAALTAIRDDASIDRIDANAWWRWPDEPASALVSHDLPSGDSFCKLFGL
jgi:type VI secretion system protein ImpM